jgi:hypothetical protein
MKPMTPRAAALAEGRTTYETGTPCKSGHLAPRAARTGTCTECTRLATKRWADQHPEKGAAYTAAYRAKNREAVLERDRLYKAFLRAENPEQHRAAKAEWYRKTVEAEGRTVRPGNLLPIADLVQRLHSQHNGALLYVGGYGSMLTNATFTCATHGGQFEAIPNNVLRGANPCPRCNHMASRGEFSLAACLAVHTPVQSRVRGLIGGKREIDVYVPEHALAVEYCGEYWHSHGDATDERTFRHRHHEKYMACQSRGIRLLTVFESEWKGRNFAIRRLLRNAVGKTRGRLMARKCELRDVPIKEARAFYDRYHPQGGSGSGEHYGLYWRGKLVACMRFTFGANDRGSAASGRAWTLTRYATRITVAGAASRLFKAFVREHNPSEVKSFSDNRYFNGDMYARLGFVMEGESPPDYQVWSPKLGLRPKAHYQRRAIPTRLQEHGVSEPFDPDTDARSEAEITYLMGCRRIYDCGKKRWVWRSCSCATAVL